MKKYLAVAVAMLTVATAQAALIVTAGGQTFSENFDTLSSTVNVDLPWTNDSTLRGWSLFTRFQGNRNVGGTPEAYVPGVYLASSGTSSYGTFYSFGRDSDRALGSIGTSSGYWGSSPPDSVIGWIAVALTNNSGGTLNGFTLGYDGEQWRAGDTQFEALRLEYGFGSSFANVQFWNPPRGHFDFSAPYPSAGGIALKGNSATNRVAGLGGSRTDAWANGETLWVRWADTNDFGRNSGLAIDNFTFTAGTATPNPVPLPAAAWLMLGGIGALGAAARRKRGSAAVS